MSDSYFARWISELNHVPNIRWTRAVPRRHPQRREFKKPVLSGIRHVVIVLRTNQNSCSILEFKTKCGKNLDRCVCPQLSDACVMVFKNDALVSRSRQTAIFRNSNFSDILLWTSIKHTLRAVEVADRRKISHAATTFSILCFKALENPILSDSLITCGITFLPANLHLAKTPALTLKSLQHIPWD